MTEEFLLIRSDVLVIAIPYYKIWNHYPTRPPLVCPCCNSFTNEVATEVALLSDNANASVHFENKSVTVKIIEFSSGVISHVL